MILLLYAHTKWALNPCFLVIAFACFILLVSETKAQPKKQWVVPVSVNQLKSTIKADANVLKEARKNYTIFCSTCHGNTGKGDGMAASSLNPKPADHTSDVVQKESDGSLFWKLSEGRNPMPAYKQILSENQRWGLIAFIRTLKRK